MMALLWIFKYNNYGFNETEVLIHHELMFIQHTITKSRQNAHTLFRELFEITAVVFY